VVSLSTGINLTLAAVGVLAAFLLFKNAGKIGSFIGGGLGEFGSNIIQGVQGLTTGAADLFTNTSPEQIVNTGGLGEFTEDVPTGGGFGMTTPLQIGRLTFAQFLKDQQFGFGGKVNISTGLFSNRFTSQQLDFTINKSTGNIRTGRIGLSDATLAKQQELSAKFGIPTFDVAGNLSTFGGVTTGKNNG